MSLTWDAVYWQALTDTIHGHRGRGPTKEEFVGTFETFYDELTAENRIRSYPVDPPGSRRMAVNRARVVWADDFSGK